MPENFIGGSWVAAHEGGRREIRCPADGRLVAEIDESTPVDTEAAIAAARAAFDDGAWPGTCLLYTSPSPRDLSTSRMPSSA